ncbi:ABC transporter ATP-binding protein NatA [Koleobacter methoxysyntrophicus]|jgi:ABC-2 type transport system ATP-binding protein|uniref:ABC transporter ATP-binding protein NatA n=2 Tax=Koleobacter methoxysyntrophicus TaxID=2751313 RepID=A0A8A0RNS4_9FIRM|nr:ABC transporter ATP-binding protein NatA [Koleobacter methoxysyntrophicus]
MMPGSKAVIVTENLTKRYGNFTAVNNLNLKITEGEIFGLLGPNGAGKTTTILMLLGLTEPSGGKALIAGYDATRDPIAVKRIVGYLPDNVGFYDDMTARENLQFTADLNAIPRKESEKRIEYLLERVGLKNVADNRVGTYSKGMRQRLGIADILIKDPKAVILDEPTIGLDPEGINELLDLIARLAKEDGRTVLISSHLLYQVQQICDRVGIFVDGNLVACGPIETLGDQISEGQPYMFEIKVEPNDGDLVEFIEGFDGIREVRCHRDIITIISEKDIRRDLLRLLNDRDYTLLHLRLCGRDLDDIYRRYFEKKGVIR